MTRLANIAARAKSQPVTRAPRYVAPVATPARPAMADDVDAGTSFFRGDGGWL